ncbi:MAG TPA: AraC family transcriptional regulator [Blastocatellia bacterium]|nr:AraC family transcriptional regulator [Blastocatellia bacterium]
MHHANVTGYEAMNPKTLAAVSFIEKNLHRKIGVVEICQSVRLSRSRLSWLFTNEMGMPPGQYLRKLRMQKGREFLESSFLTVKEIAAAVGYNDCSHFMREFKKAHDSTPSRYRAEYLTRLGKSKAAPSRRIG